MIYLSVNCMSSSWLRSKISYTKTNINITNKFICSFFGYTLLRIIYNNFTNQSRRCETFGFIWIWVWSISVSLWEKILNWLREFFFSKWCYCWRIGCIKNSQIIYTILLSSNVLLRLTNSISIECIIKFLSLKVRKIYSS